MNPFSMILATFGRGTQFDNSWQEPICLVLRILEDDYTEGFPAGAGIRTSTRLTNWRSGVRTC